MTISEELAAQMAQRARSFDAWALDYDRYRPATRRRCSTTSRRACRCQPTREWPTWEPAQARLRGRWRAAVGRSPRSSRGRGCSTCCGPGRRKKVSRSTPVWRPPKKRACPNASVDLATAAQAYHWFDKERAVPEMARIVRPGGGVAVFWNAPAVDAIGVPRRGGRGAGQIPA